MGSDVNSGGEAVAQPTASIMREEIWTKTVLVDTSKSLDGSEA
jgi:hypothetical protein